MKKFIVYSLKGNLSIIEVQCQVVTALQDPSVMWEHLPGEYKATITKPTSVFEKQPNGSFKEPVYYSHSLHDSLEEAKAVAEKAITEEAKRNERKHGVPFDVIKVLEKVNSIEVKTL